MNLICLLLLALLSAAADVPSGDWRDFIYEARLVEAEWEPHEFGDFSKLRMCVPEEEMAEWDIEQVGPPNWLRPPFNCQLSIRVLTVEAGLTQFPTASSS